MTGVLRLGVFDVDLDTRELRKQGVRVHVQDQPFEVLTLLLEHPGAVVTRARLRHKLWPDGTFVDFEHGLNAAIKRLRAALGDSAGNPRYIETRPRHGYRLIAPVGVVGDDVRPSPLAVEHSGESAEAATDNRRTRLAVLPFANLSGDPSQAYFSDGITEEMIARLGRIRPDRLGVIARTSAQRVHALGYGIDQIARELRVTHVIEGSVRRSGERVRIAVQLIDADDQTQVWAETYERRLDDCFAIQSDVAGHVADALAVELLPEQRAGRTRHGACSAEAYQAYLKGRFHWAKWGMSGAGATASASRAIGCYGQAIELDPTFGRAYAARARARSWMVEEGNPSGNDGLEAARTDAERALELDPQLTWAYLARASVRHVLDWNWAGAEADYRRAVELSPNCEAGHRGYARFLAGMSRHDAAVAESRRAAELDPYCLIVNTTHAWVLYVSGHNDEALAACRHVLDLDPEFALAHRLSGVIHLEMDECVPAVRELERAAQLEDRRPASLAWLANGLAAVGQPDDARAVLAELLEERRQRYVSPYWVAVVHAGLREGHAAFAALDRACDERALGLVDLAADPRFTWLRADERFTRLLRRIGLANDGS